MMPTGFAGLRRVGEVCDLGVVIFITCCILSIFPKIERGIMSEV
jgi:hypothetical protein